MAATAALILGSCSNEESLEVNKGHAIGFRSAVTRTTETTTDGLNAFKATALFTVPGTEPDTQVDKLYYKDVEYTRGSTDDTKSTFTSVDKYYWPNGTLTFLAYSPTTLDGTLYWTDDAIPSGKTANMLYGFSPKTSIAAQVDFITAKETGTRATNEGNGVLLPFKHQLSQIEIRAKSDSEIYNFYVKGVRIGQVANTNDFNFLTQS